MYPKIFIRHAQTEARKDAHPLVARLEGVEGLQQAGQPLLELEQGLEVPTAAAPQVTAPDQCLELLAWAALERRAVTPQASINCQHCLWGGASG